MYTVNFIVYFAELRVIFPLVASWYEKLASHAAFRTGIQKVGATTLTAASPTVPEIAASDLAEVERVFHESKWRHRKQRTIPLLALNCFVIVNE